MKRSEVVDLYVCCSQQSKTTTTIICETSDSVNKRAIFSLIIIADEEEKDGVSVIIGTHSTATLSGNDKEYEDGFSIPSE